MIEKKSESSVNLKPGVYRHFKGHEYLLIGLAKNSETLEPEVVYKALYGEGGLWVRPLSMFLEEVDTKDGRKPRFLWVRE